MSYQEKMVKCIKNGLLTLGFLLIVVACMLLLGGLAAGMKAIIVSLMKG
jgi:hypothetical protein